MSLSPNAGIAKLIGVSIQKLLGRSLDYLLIVVQEHGSCQTSKCWDFVDETGLRWGIDVQLIVTWGPVLAKKTAKTTVHFVFAVSLLAIYFEGTLIGSGSAAGG